MSAASLPDLPSEQPRQGHADCSCVPRVALPLQHWPALWAVSLPCPPRVLRASLPQLRLPAAHVACACSMVRGSGQVATVPISS